MNTRFIPRKARAVAPLLCATALLSTPAFAQDATPQAVPPPVPQAQASAPQPSAVQPAIVTPPKSATVDIPPVVSTVPEGQAQASAAEAKTAEKPAPRAETRATRTSRSVRTEARTVNRASADKPVAADTPKAAAPQPETVAPKTADAVPAPNAPAPVADTRPTTPPPAVAPAADPAPVTTTGSQTSTTTSSDVAGLPLWAWIAGGIAALVVILGGIFAMTRRRRDDEYDAPYVEETYVEPAPVVEPVVEPVSVAPVLPVVTPELRKEPEYLRRTVAPVAEIEPVIAAPDEVNVASAPSDDVAELTGGDTPVAERPWLELAMRPVRAGTNVDEALVEIELTVGNAGATPAKDVRISTFLLSGDPGAGEMEKLLIDPPVEATTDPVTIQPGEGKRVDATLALLKSQMGDNLPDSIRPVVVADARYTLPDGSEGRTSASFVVGVTPEEGGALEPIELARASMHDNVGAELHGEPQHA